MCCSNGEIKLIFFGHMSHEKWAEGWGEGLANLNLKRVLDLKTGGPNELVQALHPTTIWVSSL